MRKLPIMTGVLTAAMLLSVPLSVYAGPPKATIKTPSSDGLTKLADRGQKAFKEGNYTRAVDAYRQAYQVEPVSALLYNIAFIYDEHLKEAKLAQDYYRRYVNTPDAEVKTRLRAYERISALNAQVTPKAPAIPAPTNAAPGNTARALVEPVGRSNQKVWAYTALGVGGAALITSGALALATKNKNDEFEGSTDVMERRTLADSGESLALGSDIALGVGLTAAAIGSWLWLTAPDEQTALAPMLTNGGSGLVFVGAF